MSQNNGAAERSESPYLDHEPSHERVARVWEQVDKGATPPPRARSHPWHSALHPSDPQAGPAKLLASMVALGWGLRLVIAWGGVAHLLKTWAWRLTLLGGKYQVFFGRMLGLRLSSEAIGQFGGLAQLFWLQSG